jgi:hypothetical protein
MWQNQSYNEEIKQFNRIPRGMSTWIYLTLKILVMLSKAFQIPNNSMGTISKKKRSESINDFNQKKM